MYREAHWFCNPKCGFVCRREDKGAIQAHQEKCDYWIEVREQREAEREAYKDGLAYMRGALFLLERSKREIEIAERLIAEEKSKKKKEVINRDYIKSVLQLRLNNAKSDMLTAQSQKHDMLNHKNETTRNAAKQMYEKYVKLPQAKKTWFEDYV